VLEGVAFAFKDGLKVMQEAGVHLNSISIIGGGARSQFWRQLISDVLGMPITYRQGGEVGPALGAAKLAKINEFPSEDISTLCPVPNAIEEHSPNPARHKLLMSRYEAFTMFTNQQIKE